MEQHTVKVIARIYNGYSGKFGIPRQPGLVPQVLSRIVFEPEFRSPDALRGIEEYSHLWLIWQFSQSVREEFSPTVRPPRLGGNKRVGVFATRSPFRPNSMGLSSVRLVSVETTKEEGTVLIVSGADLMSGTPIYDVKPYVKYSDCHTDAECSFADEYSEYSLKVEISEELKNTIPQADKEALMGILGSDPRPSYQNDSERVYAFEYNGISVSFSVDGNILTVKGVTLL